MEHWVVNPNAKTGRKLMARPASAFETVKPEAASRYERAFKLQQIKEEALRRIKDLDDEIERLTNAH
jgi:hypothetical protein